MPIFKLSAAKTMLLLSGYILPRNASNFTCSCLDLKNFPGGETHGPLLTGVGKGGEGEGLKVPTSKGRGGRERTGEGEMEGGKRRGGEGPAVGAVLGEIAP